MTRLACKTALNAEAARGIRLAFAKRYIDECAQAAILCLPQSAGLGLTDMAEFLADPNAEHVVAQTYSVDGGQWMS